VLRCFGPCGWFLALVYRVDQHQIPLPSRTEFGFKNPDALAILALGSNRPTLPFRS
jgi:hypothetical protein